VAPSPIGYIKINVDGAVGLSFGSFLQEANANWQINYIPREINKVAHTLAKVALANSVTQSWTSENHLLVLWISFLLSM
jgi:hypothetical protein